MNSVRRTHLPLILGAGLSAILVALILMTRSDGDTATTPGSPHRPGPVPSELSRQRLDSDEAGDAASFEPGPLQEREPGGEAGSHRLTLIRETTDGSTFAPGEQVEVRLLLRNNCSGPVEVGPWKHRGWHDAFVITMKRVQYAYVPLRPEERLVVEPGDDYEYICLVELRDAGRVTIEGAYPPFVDKAARERFRVQLVVVEGQGPDATREKIERLATRIESERELEAASIWTQAQQDLQQVGGAAIPRLRQMLRDSRRAQARAVAAKLLSRLDGREAVPDLVVALSDPASEVRREAVEALGNFRVPDTLDALIPLIHDPAWDVRLSAVGSTAAFGLPLATRSLTDALSDENRFVRATAASELAWRGSDVGIEVLMEALRAEPIRYVTSIAESLGRLTGQDFGTAHNPMFMSGIGQMEEAEKKCLEVAKKWLEWWESGGVRKPK